MRARHLLAGLLAAGLGSSSPPARAEGQTWAVVVGIDDYSKESIPDLRYAGSDAKVFAQALQKLLKIAPDHLFLFTGDATDSNQTPNRLNLIYRLDWLSKSAKADDIVIFYFAGHGAQVGSDSFLLMKDSDNRSLETLKASALNKADLNRLISRTSAGRTLTVLDACRNDPSGAASVDAAALASFAESATGREVVGLLSCSPGQRSWEWEEKKHGFFTYYLVEALQGNLKGNITPNSLAEYLSAKVSPSTQAVIHQIQTPRMFYDGPSTTNWVLGASQAAASIKELDIGAARDELASARLADLEARLRSEELRRKQAEARVEALEKRAPVSAGSDEVQKLVVARDLALKELLDTRKQLETVRTQLTGRSGPSAEAQLLEAEHLQLVAENKVLKAKIVVLEEKLGGAGSSGGGKAGARSFTLEENGPLSAEVKALQGKYQQSPSPELKRQLTRAQIENEASDAKQYGDELTRLGGLYEKQVLESQQSASDRQQMQQELTDINALGGSLVKLGECQRRRAQNGVSMAEKLLAVTEGTAPSGTDDEINRLRAENRDLEKEKDYYRELVLKKEDHRRVLFSRYFRDTNTLPGLGDIFDVVPVGPELQSLP